MARTIADLQRAAVARALAAGLHRRVMRIKYGIYLVASTSRAVVHCVSHDPATPEALQCSCEAGQRGRPCLHAAAVWLAKLEAAGLRVKPVSRPVPATKKEAA